MNSRYKSTIVIIVGALLLIGAYFFYIYISGLSEKASFSHQVAGKIVRVTTNSIAVEGIVRLADPKANPLKRVFTIGITPDTKLIKTTWLFKKSDVPYAPEKVQTAGTAKDLQVGTIIIKIVAKEDMSAVTVGTALEINYGVPSFQN